jgi:hypothetical protein
MAAWVVATDAATNTAETSVAALHAHTSIPPVTSTADIERANSELFGADWVIATPDITVELRAPSPLGDSPLRYTDPDMLFLFAAVTRLTVETSTAATTIEVIPAAAVVSDTPELRPGDRVRTTISFYYCEHDSESINPAGDGGGFCGQMRDGDVVYEGAAACAYAYLGQQFRILGDPDERIYRCADTGSAVGGQHRDIWFRTADEGWDWLWLVGPVATIEVLP